MRHQEAIVSLIARKCVLSHCSKVGKRLKLPTLIWGQKAFAHQGRRTLQLSATRRFLPSDPLQTYLGEAGGM